MPLTYRRMSASIEQRFPRPSVMGVVNVTPDSFSDGGVNFEPDTAAAAARRMVAEGATIVDIGGESTRPGASPVDVDAELRRVVPVLEQLEGVPVSIDTSKAEVARRAVELGAELVNDVTALRGDTGLADVVAESDAYLCLMHMIACSSIGIRSKPPRLRLTTPGPRFLAAKRPSISSPTVSCPCGLASQSWSFACG